MSDTNMDIFKQLFYDISMQI